MILDSSEEEDDDETQEEEPIDFAAEAARTLARSASKTYVMTLIIRGKQAAADPELHAKQLNALAQHARNHPEMASRPRDQPQKPQERQAPQAPQAPQGPQVQSPASLSAASVSPASPASPASPVSPVAVAVTASPKRVRAQRAKTEPTPKAEKPMRRQQTSPTPKKKASKRKEKVPRAENRPEGGAEQKAFQEEREEREERGSLEHTWASAASEKAQTTQTMTTVRPSPKAMSASMTQLASCTWRGPVETSGNDREMFLRSLSKHESMPLLTFRPRRGKDLWVTNVSNPAPDTYPRLDESCTSKYLAPRQVSFGFSRKGSRWPANADQKPGPGAHSVVNFERFKFAEPVRHSFGGAPRGRPNPIRQTGPGPGAYGVQRSADEEGPAVTMTGKHRKRGVLNPEDPGPGAYNPTMVLCGPTAPSVGFATALREDFYPREDKCIPAPGTYDVTNYDTGSDCLAFSLVGKRKRHDLTAHLYAGPGPGFYNHGSTFGYRSTWHAPPILSPPIGK